MFQRSLLFIFMGWTILFSSSIHAEDCCQSLDVSVGWRRDSLDWKTKGIHSDHAKGHAKSHIFFKDIESYTLSGEAKWAGTDYYVRASAEYGLSFKGRAHENFFIDSRILRHDIHAYTNDHIKKNSEFYDFDAAIGYPFSFLDCRLSIIPLIGFSFHRQHLRVKEKKHHCPCEYSSSFSSSSSFCIECSNPFFSGTSSNPFASSSEPNINSELGLFNPHRTDNYRFTWYGFYLGADIAYALDCCWTLFAELEGHFLDRCHRKRNSWTGVSYVDDYHHEGWAYGFNGVVGLTYAFSTCWYSIVSVDYDWWIADKKKDHLEWKKVGAKIGVGYMF